MSSKKIPKSYARTVWSNASPDDRRFVATILAYGEAVLRDSMEKSRAQEPNAAVRAANYAADMERMKVLVAVRAMLGLLEVK
jgi:hypothetical protein